MDHILIDNSVFTPYEYQLEKDFEQVVIENASHIFGPRTIYIDIKKRIGEKDSIITISDGYLIDFSFESEPRLYIIENELSGHDPYKHIGSQLLKFAISYKASGRKIKSFLLTHILENLEMKKKVEEGLEKARYRNIDDFLESLIFEKPVAALVVIDESTPELNNVLRQLAMTTEILELKTYVSGNQKVHRYTPFNAEIREIASTPKSSVAIEELDTIVVPAQEDGFEEEFLNKDRWFAIRIGASMLDRIKYIAAYQVAPVSAITWYAEVASIEKFEDTNKYILYFKEKAKKIGPIELNKDKKGLAPQAPRYTSMERLKKARSMFEAFPE